MESSSLPGQIQVSEPVAAALSGSYTLEPRGDVELKGKGPTAAYFLTGRKA
jgi:class 3 adenylate cyclase